MRGLAVIALALALGSPVYAQTTDTTKPEAKAPASHKPAKPAKKRKNDGTDESNVGTLRCRDVRTHRFAKCGGPYSEPVPAE